MKEKKEKKAKWSWQNSGGPSYLFLKDRAIFMRKNPTPAEKIMWEILRKNRFGVKFRRQYILGQYIVDFINLDFKLIIEIDGEYHFTLKQQLNDNLRTEFFSQHNFKVIRFTNDEILSSPLKVIDMINQAINSEHPSPLGGKEGGQMSLSSKIFVAGHRGMVGSAIVRELKRQGYINIITRSHAELDLTDQKAVNDFFEKEKPEYVFLAAAKVGGIMANSNAPADFMYQNMMLEMNVIHASWKSGVKKLLFLGSSCIYPRLAPQPMPESCLLTSALEPTNEAYALAKISGLKYCEYLNRQYGTDFISVMPTNLYGPNDNYHPENSHVLPALIRRFHEAKVKGAESVTCWGDGSPLREFLYVDDLANLCVFLMNNYSGNETVNAGIGKEISIKDLTDLVASIIGYTGKIEWDITKPNGTPRKLLDVSKATALGWTFSTPLSEGIRLAYSDFLGHSSNE